MASEKKSRKLLVLALIAVILILIAVIVYLVGFGREPEKEERGKAVLLTENNVEEFETQKEVEDGYYLVTMNTSWEFDNGSAESNNAYVANVEQNTRTVYFDVFLSDTGENVYSSPYMPVGTELRNFALDKDLEAGDYTAVVTYHLLDDDNNEIDDVSAEVTIHILN